MARSARRALVLIGPALLLLAGCGGGGGDAAPDNGETARPAARILQDTVAALRTATAVHMYGTIPTGGDSIGLDLHCARSGDLDGTITVGGVTGRIVVTGGSIYLQGRSLFTALFGAPASARIGDHWLAMPGGSGTGSDIVQGLGTFTDFNHLADLLAMPTGGTVTRGAVSSVDGQSTVSLRDSDSVLYVATTGSPLPVELKPDAGGDALHFADWDQAVHVSAPSGALDLSAIAGELPGSASPSP